MTDLREELRLIGCHANGDARSTCNIGQDALALIVAQAAEIERLTRERDQAREAVKVQNGVVIKFVEKSTAAKAEAEKLRAALKPFAEEAQWWIDQEYSENEHPVEAFPGYDAVMTCGDLFRARAALGQKP